MKCGNCGCDLSPEKKDEVLQALAEGIVRPSPICDDCLDYIALNENDMWEEDDVF